MRRLAGLVILPAVWFVPLWLGSRLIVAMNADPPVREAFALKGALQGARRARAGEFAPADLRAAEAEAEQALNAYYRVIARSLGFLSYDEVRQRLRDATARADSAWSLARRKSQSESQYAMRLIDEGRAVVGAADAVVVSSPIGAAVRTNLARARVSIQTAAARWRAGDYKAAARQAIFARDTANEVRKRASTFLDSYTTSAAAQKWAQWVGETIDQSRRTGDYVVLVDKLHHKCHLYRSGSLLRTYDADLGGTLWDKMHAGDRATPEGMYRVVQKRRPGQTTYYKALLINYPNDEDRAQFALAKKNGWISRRAAIGGLIEIHGEGGRREDWTLGCVALRNRDMDELFRLVDIGTPVTIVGTISRESSITG